MEIRKRSFDLITMGQILLRLSPPGNERMIRSDHFEKNVGGAELNVAVGASLLGLRTGVISKLPSHDLGQYLKSTIRSYGVSDDYFIYDDRPDGRVGIYFYEYGAYPRKPKLIYDRRDPGFFSLRTEEIDERVYRDAGCFHISGITLALCPELRRTATEVIRRFREAGALISFDVNFRGNLWSGEEARRCVEELLPYIDIFFCSESTARLTFQREGSTREILRSFTEDFSVRLVFATERTVHSPKRHDFTSLAYSAEEKSFYEEEPYRDIEVVDRIGSGDAYIAGALYGLLSSGGNVRQAVIYGNASAAMKNTIPGDLLQSDRRELDHVISDHSSSGFHSEMDR